MTATTPPARIGVIYTGGTFGMVPSDHGLVPSLDLPARAQHALAETGQADAAATLTWLDHGWPPLASADLAPAVWYDLARRITQAPTCDGFVVIHGTDTLAYTASALSYLLAGLGRPVVVTGASKPLGMAGSDALDHFVDALSVARRGVDSGVTVAFGRRLLRANRTSKRFGTTQQPFASPRAAPLADLAAGEYPPTVEPSQPDWGVVDGAAPPAVHHECRVGVVPAYPGIDGATLAACAHTHPDALLLEGYAAGIGPGADAGFVDAIRDATACGTVVTAIADSAHGSVRMGYYASSTPLAEAGLVAGADMTREAALTKLHVSLCAGLDAGGVAAAFARNQCGELTATAG